MDDAYVNEIPLAYQKAIALVPKFTGFLSLLGSSWIFYEVITDKKKRQSMYHRLLLCMSISDWNSSFWTYVLSSWMLPSESYSANTTFFSASGTWATCNLQGFMFQLGIATPLYNAALSLYYVLLLKYNWTPKQMARQIEPYLHAGIISFSVATSIAPLFMTLYNPTITSWCAITEYPYNCHSENDGPVHNEEDTTKSGNNDNGETRPLRVGKPAGWNFEGGRRDAGVCLRGRSERWATLFQWLFEFIPLWLVIGFTTINMALVYHTVRHQEKKMETRYKFHGLTLQKERQEQQQEQRLQAFPQAQPHGAEQSPSRVAAHDNTSTPPRAIKAIKPRKKQRESERILTISILYTSSFYATFGFHTVLNAMSMGRGFDNANPDVVFAIVMMNNICLPLQGAFNCFIYLYPRYQRYKERHLQQTYDEKIRQQQLLEQKHHHKYNSGPNLQVVVEQAAQVPSHHSSGRD
jgi:hypothetical protein